LFNIEISSHNNEQAKNFALLPFDGQYQGMAGV
jgi:hypothetical protein